MSGYIFAIGGGDNIDLDIFRKMLQVSKNNKILLITDASTLAATNHTLKAKNYFNKFYNKEVDNCKLNKFKSKSDLLNTFYSNGIIYFTGGHQSYLKYKISSLEKKLGINLSNILQQYLQNGGVIGGTSAGASILGKKMPTGLFSSLRTEKIYLNKNYTIDIPIYKVSNSLNLLPYIIDQHFTQKNRHHRGIAMAIDNKTKVLGIDEDTAIYHKYGTEKIYIIGKNHVTVYDGSQISYYRDNKNKKIFVNNFSFDKL